MPRVPQVARHGFPIVSIGGGWKLLGARVNQQSAPARNVATTFIHRNVTEWYRRQILQHDSVSRIAVLITSTMNERG